MSTLDRRRAEVERIGGSPAYRRRVERGVIAAVSVSFAPGELERATKDEVKRRASLAYDFFMQLRVDCHYSTAKALGLLPDALVSKLVSGRWEPPASARAFSPSRLLPQTARVQRVPAR